MCAGSNGIGIPIASAPPTTTISVKDVDSKYATIFRKLSIIRLPSSIAATIVEKLLSSKISPDASFATSVPDPSATPMLAARSAGASFTPSPVIATISPCAWSMRTIRSLCSGSMRAKTVVWWSVFPISSSVAFSMSEPCITISPSFQIPDSSAIVRAVSGLSPVIMITRAPAFCAIDIDSFTSSRNGSCRIMKPQKISPSVNFIRYASLSFSNVVIATSRYPTAMTRYPFVV